jgi:hypothetical protein
MKIIIFFIGFVCISALVQAEITVKLYQQIKHTDEFKFYLHGLGTGYSWANYFLKQHGQPELFCPPEKLSLTPQNYNNILAEQLKILGNKTGPDDFVDFILLDGLIRTFPCHKK